jgi:hypothetical protein
MAEDISLLSLAAWLNRQSEQAIAAAEFDAEEYGMRATMETAARLAQASRVIKAAADYERQNRGSTQRPFAANQA